VEVAEVAAKEVAALNEVAEVEAVPNEVAVEAGLNEVAGVEAKGVAELKEVAEVEAMPNKVEADSVADSHPGSRRAARNAAMPARGRSVVVPGDLALIRVPGREAQDDQALAREARGDRVPVQAARVNRELVRAASAVQRAVSAYDLVSGQALQGSV
jgi:hypothetical protein